jgi:uncharacterized protein YjbI with pentapeptide repeats
MNTAFFSNNKLDDYLSFNFNAAGPTFSIQKETGSGLWNFDNQYMLSGDSPTVSLGGGGPFFVKLYSDSFKKIKHFNCNGVGDIYGTLDLSLLSNVTTFDLSNNTNLTDIILPNNSEIISRFWVYGCDLQGHLNLTNLTNLRGSFDVNSNANLTAITFPTTTWSHDELFSGFSKIDLSYCNLQGHLDLTKTMCSYGANYRFQNNTGLTSVTFANNTWPPNLIDLSYCDVKELNLTPLSGGYTSVWVDYNSNLTALTLNSFSNRPYNMTFTYCNLSHVDFSKMYRMPDRSSFTFNRNLTAFTLTSSTLQITDFSFDYCDIREANLSSLSSFTNVSFLYNPNLSSITFSTNAYKMGYFNISSSALTDINLSVLTKGINQIGISARPLKESRQKKRLK